MNRTESGTTKILLVDDEPDVEGMVKLKFRKEISSGIYDFVFAENGCEALKKLTENPDINIVISDINMPKMDGLTLLNRMSELNRLLRAIIVSAYGDMTNIRQAMNNGAYDFIVKPIDFQDLATTIEKTKKNLTEIKSNIDALRQAKESLKESLARNSAIVSTASDSIITFDSNGIIEAFNPAAAASFGNRSGDLAGRSITELIHSIQVVDGELCIYTEDFSEPIGFPCRDIDTYGYNYLGLSFPVEIAVSEFKINDKQMFTGIIRDVTLRKRAENLLKEYNVMLESEVSERTKRLNKLNQEKNELLGIVAHDLKNPLSNIKMLSKVLLDESLMDTDEVKEFAQDIYDSAVKMFELIRNLLDINAIEQGKVNLNIERFNFVPQLINQLDFFKEQAKLKKISIDHHLKVEDEIYILADRMAFMQILDNYISNAIKFSPSESTIHIQFMAKDDEVVIGVKDEGPGIKREEINLLFTKFTKLSNKPTGGEDSTGLGLSIVKKLAELMAGKVWCESEFGEGATFFVEFPKA